MKDYSLQRNTEAPSTTPQGQVTPTQAPPSQQSQGQNMPQATRIQAPQYQPQQSISHMEQLSQASQQSKTETENALLREALAMSAQNLEALVKQSVKSQEEFQHQIEVRYQRIREETGATQITLLEWVEEMRMIMSQNNENYTEMWSNLEGLMNQNHQQYQDQLIQLHNQNQLFSKSLNEILIGVVDKLVEQVKNDTVTALNSNMSAMNSVVDENLANMRSVVIEHIESILEAHKLMQECNQQVIDYDKSLKTKLDNSIKKYNTAITRLFQLNNKEKLYFRLGIFGGIATPVVLIVGWIGRGVINFFS